jgi:hypothetical protein
MKRADARINLDRKRLLAFNQIKATDDGSDCQSAKSPAMTMFGTKVCKKKRKLAAS